MLTGPEFATGARDPPMATPGPARRSVRSPGDLVEIAALTLALTAAGTTVPAGASADAGPLVASSGAVAAETTNSGVRGPSESRDSGGEEDARGANIQTQGACLLYTSPSPRD